MVATSPGRAKGWRYDGGRGTMSVVMSEPLVLRDRHYTVDDLDDVREDNFHRYEIIDGVLVVSGAPRVRHQRAVGRIYQLLAAACPAGLEAFVAPLAVLLAHDTMMQPDVLVARVADLTEGELPVPPVLAVEVLSPGSRTIDLRMKYERHERAGTPHYWVVDPNEDPSKAQLHAFTLTDGAYRQVADVTGDEAFETTAPVTVRVVPARLVD
jgi:Uma2 family endonuclease